MRAPDKNFGFLDTGGVYLIVRYMVAIPDVVTKRPPNGSSKLIEKHTLAARIFDLTVSLYLYLID
jgi:hypothetical protein